MNPSPDITDHPPRILIVDDERHNRQVLEAMLGSEEFLLQTAASGEEALTMVAEQPPDLILLDIMMPGMDGYQVVSRIKGDLATKNIPVIMVTALDDRNARLLGLSAGAEDFLSKPVDPAELCVRVRNLLRLKRYGDYHDKYSQMLEGEVASRTADLAAIAIHNTQLYEQAQRNLKRIQALREIETAINSTLDLGAVLNVLLEKIEIFLPHYASTVRLHDGRTGDLDLVASRNIAREEWKKHLSHPHESYTSAVFQSLKPLAIRNIKTDRRVLDHGFLLEQGLISLLAVPLVAKETAVGVLTLYGREERDFTGEEIEFLSAIACQAAIAINNSQLYDQTKRQAEVLERSKRVKNEFLSVMSHELRTPLSIIMGYTALIRDGMLGAVNDEQADALKKVLGRADEQLHMINDLMQATQIESRSMTVERLPVNLKEMMDSLKQDYEMCAGKASMTIVWDYPAGPVEITTDGAKLKQVLQNLINNAIKFTDDGTVTVSARVENLDSRRIVCKVTDTGVGIPTDRLPVIFDKFYQVDSSETRLHGGVGLGLFIVKKFVALMGGAVAVESQLGKGSIFIVTIPVG